MWMIQVGIERMCMALIVIATCGETFCSIVKGERDGMRGLERDASRFMWLLWHGQWRR